jgi:hypothetical protein
MCEYKDNLIYHVNVEPINYGLQVRSSSDQDKKCFSWIVLNDRLLVL